MAKKSTFFDELRKWGFIIFFALLKKINWNWARSFLYASIAEKNLSPTPYKNPLLNISVLRKEFPNPIGISAGFDPSFKYNDELMSFGFGFEEFGTFTINPVGGRPSVHFAPNQKGLFVESLKFNNIGIKAAQKALIERRHLPYIVGVSIASNFEQQNEDKGGGNVLFSKIESELTELVQRAAPYCDYIVLNLSHPVLPISTLSINLSTLEQIVRQLKTVIQKVAPISNPPLLIKVPLDVSPAHIPLLAETLLRENVDGIILGGYLGLSPAQRKQLKLSNSYGHLTGAPLRAATTQLVEQFYSVLQGRIPIIASGGTFTGDDAFEKITAGASLVQIHTAILYDGPKIANKINARLADLLKQHGFRSLQDAVGSKFRNKV